jgi:hypothetical protein
MSLKMKNDTFTPDKQMALRKVFSCQTIPAKTSLRLMKVARAIQAHGELFEAARKQAFARHNAVLNAQGNYDFPKPTDRLAFDAEFKVLMEDTFEIPLDVKLPYQDEFHLTALDMLHTGELFDFSALEETDPSKTN